MPGEPFSLADLREAEMELARDLGTMPATIRGWFDGKRLPDLRHDLADLCRRKGADDPGLRKVARKLEKRGPPESARR